MNSVADIIGALGTNVEVADGIDVKPSTVSEFKRRNSIPVRYWPRLIAFAAGREKPVTADMLMAAHEQPQEAIQSASETAA